MMVVRLRWSWVTNRLLIWTNSNLKSIILIRLLNTTRGIFVACLRGQLDLLILISLILYSSGLNQLFIQIFGGYSDKVYELYFYWIIIDSTNRFDELAMIYLLICAVKAWPILWLFLEYWLFMLLVSDFYRLLIDERR